MKLKRIDSISMDQTYYTDEGYLVDHPIVTTCGIFTKAVGMGLEVTDDDTVDTLKEKIVAELSK